ncbi:MAG: hypothetical protein HC934_14280 [Acaryochloridaceae cyanobacterium SU_2_1]|nr:hypothetical protein [Acaryochloridaceae cyanobacterium SU_2_1]
MLISNFEILVKPIAPAGPPGVARTVVQAYFLTISNLDPNSDVSLDIDFTAITPDLSTNVITFFDVIGSNDPSALIPLPGGKKFRRTVTLPACDTGLFLLQPDIIINPALLTAANLEIRGYVEISVSPLSAIPAVQLLVTPEHRGTFIPQDLIPPPDLDFDQLAYALPIAGGKAIIALP